jgi:phospholipid/cholesterol/gamma-HCH transport system substrate-binding protein
VRRALRAHRRDAVAVLGLLVLALASAGYILAHQASFTLFDRFYVVHADFASAAAVSPGQGEAVTIAGVPVGVVGAVSLADGHAVVTMDIDRADAPIYANATVLLRERTPLKDMYLSLDPGTRSAGAIPDGGTLGLGQTEPDTNIDAILASLDADTRTYLLLALSGGATALSGRSPAALRAVFKRFPPLLENTVTFTRLLARRSRDLRAAISDLDAVAGALGGVDGALGTLVSASDRDFRAIADEDGALGRALIAAPATLAQTQGALTAVGRFGAVATPALARLIPFTRTLAPALAALSPLAAATTAPINDRLSPFTAAVTPLARTLAPAGASLATDVPALSSSLAVLNALLNALAHRPGTGDSYLFWGAWLAHNADSVLALQDADGAVAQSLFMASCPALGLLENELAQNQPSIGALLALLNAPDAATLHAPSCPAAG